MRSKIILIVLIVLAIVFGGLWGFQLTQTAKYKKSSQDLSDSETAKITKTVEAKIQKQFEELDKSPVLDYQTSDTFGSLKFSYPKTWSVYSKPDNGNPNLYLNPKIVPSVDNTNNKFGLRVQILNEPLASHLSRYDDDIKNKKLTSVGVNLAINPDITGSLLAGTIDENKKGKILLLPLRDKTIKFTNENPDLTADFDTYILPSIDFTP